MFVSMVINLNSNQIKKMLGPQLVMNMIQYWHLYSSYLSKFIQSPCLLEAITTMAIREKRRAAPLNTKLPLFNRSSLFHRLAIEETVSWDGAVWFSTSGRVALFGDAMHGGGFSLISGSGELVVDMPD